MKQHVRAANSVDLGIRTNDLNVSPAALGHQIIAETPQIENRLMKTAKHSLFVRLEDLSDAVRNNAREHTEEYITPALQKPRTGMWAKEEETEHEVRVRDCEQRRDGKISQHRRDGAVDERVAQYQRLHPIVRSNSNPDRPGKRFRDDDATIRQVLSDAPLQNFNRSLDRGIVHNNRSSPNRGSFDERCEEIAASIKTGQQDCSKDCHSFRASRSLVGPDREFVTARVRKVEPATTRKVERIFRDPPTRLTDLHDRRLEIIGVQDD